MGHYAGGRLRITGAKQPINIRDHAVVFDGLKRHSLGLFNGDQWTVTLFVHASWERISDDIAKRFKTLGSPCPPTSPPPTPTQAIGPALSDDDAQLVSLLPKGGTSAMPGISAPERPVLAPMPPGVLPAEPAGSNNDPAIETGTVDAVSLIGTALEALE